MINKLHTIIAMARQFTTGIFEKPGRKKWRHTSLLFLATGFFLALITSVAAAQSAGETAYKQDCAVCHGAKGKGDGEAVRVLVGLQPSDLTQLSRRNGGKFPADAVYRVIDGRDDIGAHHLGTRRMPLWGLQYQMDNQCTAESATQGCKRINDLVHYIETLQQ